MSRPTASLDPTTVPVPVAVAVAVSAVTGIDEVAFFTLISLT